MSRGAGQFEAFSSEGHPPQQPHSCVEPRPILRLFFVIRLWMTELGRECSMKHVTCGTLETVGQTGMQWERIQGYICWIRFLAPRKNKKHAGTLIAESLRMARSFSLHAKHICSCKLMAFDCEDPSTTRGTGRAYVPYLFSLHKAAS